MLRALHWFVEEATLWVVYEASEWQTFFELLEGAEQGLPEPIMAATLRQVLPVVSTMHAQGVPWSDIRPVHILVEASGRVQVVLHSLRSLVRLKTRDSLPFVAPEQLSKTDRDPEELWRQRVKGDIWALVPPLSPPPFS